MGARLRTIAAGLASVLLAGILLLLEPASYKGLREAAIGAVLQLRAPPESGQVVVVDIESASVETFGSWPWPRRQLADLIAAIGKSGARAVALDIVLGGRCGPSPDNLSLASAFADIPVTVGFVVPGVEEKAQMVSPVAVKPPIHLPMLWRSQGAEMPCQEFRDGASGLAAASISGEASGHVTTVPAIMAVGNTLFPGLGIDAVRLWSGAAAVMTSGGNAPVAAAGAYSGHLDSSGGLRLHPTTPTRWISRSIAAVAVLEAAQPLLKDKLVIVGSSLPQLGGLRPTAADPLTPSIQIHADIAESLLTGSVPWRPPFAMAIEFAAMLLGTAIIIAASLWLRPLQAALVALAVTVGLALAVIFAAHGLRLVFDPFLPPFIVASAGVAAGLSQYVTSRQTEAAMRLSFEQRLPASVVARLAQGKGGQRIESEVRTVTALFTDIEGFTAMTAAVSPQQVVELLNGYFEGITRIIHDSGGFIDKIVGDAAHVFFNMPSELDNHEARALECAQAIVAFSERYRETPLAKAAAFGRTRIGIETGLVVAGDVGAEGKFDYSAHGTAVNLASRLQEANKVTGTNILVGPGMKAANPSGWHLDSLGTLDFRGLGMTEIFTPRKI